MNYLYKQCGYNRKVYFILLSFFVIGLLLKYFIFIKDGAISRDGAKIIIDSQIWNQTGDFSAIVDNFKFYHTPPLYHFLIKQFSALNIDPFLGGLSINILLGNLLIITTFFISKALLGMNSVSLFSAFLTMIHPTVNQLSLEIQRDIPYLFFTSLTFLLFIKGWKTKKILFWGLSGSLIGVNLLIRYESLELAPIGVILIFCSYLKQKLIIYKIATDELLFISSIIMALCLGLYIMGIFDKIRIIYFDFLLPRFQLST